MLNGSDTAQNTIEEAIRAAQDALHHAYLSARIQPMDGEATQIAQDAVWWYVDQAAVIGRNNLALWAAASQAGLRTAFGLQNASVEIWRALFDSAVQADRTWFDQATASVRRGQDATLQLVAAAFGLSRPSCPSRAASPICLVPQEIEPPSEPTEPYLA